MGLSTQFHALPSETLELVSDLLSDEAVFVVGIWSGRDEPVLLSRPFQPEKLATANTLLFTLEEPVLAGKTRYAVLSANPDALTLDLGHLTPDSLAESWISTGASDGATFKRWQKTVRQLRRGTMTGAVAYSPETGAEAPMRAHRFTVGAQKLHADGRSKRPVAGTVLIRLPTPDGC